MLSKIQDRLIPSFLKRLDFWLMTHKPHIWRTKGHFVAFYAAIVSAVFFVVGLIWPYTLFNLQELRGQASDILFPFGVMSFFLVLGGIFLWWFSIQKYAYRRTNIQYFLTEVGIYALSIFALWTVFLAFTLGFEYKRCFMLEKNAQSDKDWFNSQHFSDFGYMPHVDPNKLTNLSPYFANGEKLIALQQKRAVDAFKFKQNLDKKRYVFADDDIGSNLRNPNWELQTIYNQTVIPPQYKQPSAFYLWFWSCSRPSAVSISG